MIATTFTDPQELAVGWLVASVKPQEDERRE
jgi:hypothetical protein